MSKVLIWFLIIIIIIVVMYSLMKVKAESDELYEELIRTVQYSTVLIENSSSIYKQIFN